MDTLSVFLIFFGLYFVFTQKAGKCFPILYLFAFIYFIQYIFSVYLIYNQYAVLRRAMVISQSQLFQYLIPALLFLFAGVFLFNKDVDVSGHLKRIEPKRAAQLGHLLLFVSYFFELVSAFGIPELKSILSFTSPLRFSGAMCYLFTPSPFNYLLAIFVYLGLAAEALGGGVFIDFFMWAAYLFLIASHRFQLSFVTRSTFILVTAPLLILIQSVKLEYREATWTGKRESGVGLLTELISEKQNKEEDPFRNSDGVISTVGRLNQGWHLGMVLKRVPSKEPFSNGADFLSDMEGVLLPRIFFPGKKVIGSKDKFEKFTGHRIEGNSSMTIGILGDFYVNFGKWGSYIGLFIFGALVARVFYWFLRKYVVTDPINIVWIPFLFNYLVRANNDFYTITNNLFKGLLVFLFINYLRKQLWPPPTFTRQ